MEKRGPSIYLFIYVFIYSIFLFVCLFIYLFICFLFSLFIQSKLQGTLVNKTRTSYKYDIANREIVARHNKISADYIFTEYCFCIFSDSLSYYVCFEGCS